MHCRDEDSGSLSNGRPEARSSPKSLFRTELGPVGRVI